MRDLYAIIQKKGSILFPVTHRRAHVEIPAHDAHDDGDAAGDRDAGLPPGDPDDGEADGARDAPAEADAADVHEWGGPDPAREAAEEK
eukprot:8612592-Pyramimonas_sp.AAC.1